MSDLPANLSSVPPLGQNLKDTLAIIDKLSPEASVRYTWNQVRFFLQKLTGKSQPTFTDCPPMSMIRGRIFPTKAAGIYARPKGGQLEARLSELGPRAPESVRNFGRCHLPGSSVFYASFSEETVLGELRPVPGDMVYLLYCEPVDRSGFKSAMIGEIDHIRRTGEGSFSKSDAFVQDIKAWLAEVHSEEHYARLVADAFLAEFIRRPCAGEADYRVVSALAGMLLASNADYPGSHEALYYPSVAYRGGTNIALAYDCYKQKVRPVSAKILYVRNYFGYGVYQTVVIAQSSSLDVKNDKITWQAVPTPSKTRYPDIQIN